MPQWRPRVLTRVHALAAQGKVRFTLKALTEMAALSVGLDESDGCDALRRLSAKELVGRMRSAQTREWMYVFRARIAGTLVYLKIILRDNCVVVSFHAEAEDDDDEEGR